jgi:exoribonuclease R
MLATKDYKRFQIVNEVGDIQIEFEGAETAYRALPEDKVMISGAGKVILLERAAKKNLVGVLNLTSKYVYGMTGHGVPMYLCEPYNKAYPPFRVASKEKDRSQNLIVVFQFETWELGNELPRGALVQVLGCVEDPYAERLALAWHSCPWSAPRPETFPEVYKGSRPLLTEGTFNIDPPGCKDIDDVITLTQIGSIWRIWITIADVSEVIQENTNSYTMAKKIAATTYQDGCAVKPMFHPEISEKACSLLPGQTRYGVALRLDWYPETGFQGEPVFEKVLVQNQEAYTYESIYTSKTVPLTTLKAICSSLAGREITDSHEWIEHLMITYNREAAKVLQSMNAGLLRAHDIPFQEKADLLQKINPTLAFLAYQSARYSAVCDGGSHWGLGQALYCHATSPLRRFADFENQQILKDSIDGVLYKRDSSVDQELARWLNKRQKEIAAAERFYVFLTAVQKADTSTILGTYLWSENKKAVFWIEAWKTMIKVPCEDILVGGEQKQIEYYCDRRKASWKDRILFRFAS